MPKFLLISCCLLVSSFSFSQKHKKQKDLDEAGIAEILNKTLPDSVSFLRSSGQSACACIDSVDRAEPNKEKRDTAFSDCIEKQVTSYEMMLQIGRSLKSKEKNNSIYISDKNSDQHKHYYYDIEKWLRDSCKSLNRSISTNNVTGEKSYSSNKEAMDAYNKGVKLFENENYTASLPLFEKAVSIDPQFAFAWDNIGVCYRHIGDYDKAIAAYKTSLKIDSSGKTPLQNLPIVYLMQKKDDAAIAAYQDILRYYPGDPEVYYGIGLVYYTNKNDMEMALDYMCKAYNIYVGQKSPYRTDAEKVINQNYAQMKKDNKVEKFNSILKENNIKTN